MSKNINLIRAAVSSELARTFRERSPEMGAELAQTLAKGVALVVTQLAMGDQKAVSDMLDGLTQYIHEEASDLMPIARLMASVQGKGK